MPKMKSKRGLMKRVKVTGSGKVTRHHAYVSHLAPHKTTKQKRPIPLFSTSPPLMAAGLVP